MADEKIARCVDEAASQSPKIFLLFIIGFFMIFVGIAILVVASVLLGGRVDIGGVIFIWFIPIVFGTGPNATLMVLFAIVLAVLGIIMFLILRKSVEKAS